MYIYSKVDVFLLDNDLDIFSRVISNAASPFLQKKKNQ